MNMHLNLSWKQTAAATVLLVVAAGSASAFAEGRLQKSDFTSLRLLNAGMESGEWKAGIEITMKPGWKTYWRVPGESGVPPQFDWAASENAGNMQVDMPVPKRFRDDNGEGIGYQGTVVFPVSVNAI